MNKSFTRWLLCMLVCMFSSATWALDQVGGVYQIGTGQDLADFAALVNGGDVTANAVLTADIDYTGQTTMIGSRSKKFAGTLDGQGHTITLDFTATAENYSLFGYVCGAVRNLRVTGTVKAGVKVVGGIISNLYGGLLENCYCDVVMEISMTGDATCGGLVGRSGIASSLRNCVFAGKLVGKAAQRCGGLIGWVEGSTSISNCLQLGEMDIDVNADSYALGRNSQKEGKINNCYVLKGFRGTVDAGVTEVTSEQVESGEVAFRAGMGQKLDTDKVPSPLNQNRVYATATSCSGEGATGFTNNKAEAQMPEHSFTGYKCSVCGALNEEFVAPENGVYKISTAEQMAWVAEMVNSGHMQMNVQLTADIDLGAYTEWPMIGRLQFPYRGHFDGQHHKISNLVINYPKGVGVGFFGTIAGPAVVENLTLDKSCSILGLQHVGLIGHTKGQTYVKLQGLGNQGSVAAVPSNQGGSGDAGVGGIIGNSPDQCLGTITNCWFTGKVLSGTSCAFISGWTGTDQYTLKGCWAISDTHVGVAEATAIARSGSGGTKVKLINCATNYGTQGTLVPAEAMGSGELCYVINGKSSEAPVWHQTLGTDEMPTLNGEGTVYQCGSKNCDGTYADDFGYFNEDKGFVQKPHTIDPNTGLCTLCGKPDMSEDGFYLICNAKTLRWVAEQINSGAQSKLNFRLTADIDLAGENWIPIGDDTHPYAGEMDGGRHKISNMIVDVEGNAGFFGTVTQSSLHDLLIDASCSVRGGQRAGGLIGHTTGSFTTNITNVGTMCNVSSYGTGNFAAAGIIGNANNGNVTNITRCFSTGRIEAFGDAACISAWEGDVGAKVTDCWTTSVIADRRDYSFCRGKASTVISGCYCANDYKDNLPANVTGTISADMIGTGQLCFVVNGSQSDTPVWYQTLGTDAAPVPWNDHKVVYANGDLRCDGTTAGGTVTYSNDKVSVTPPHTWHEGFCTVCGKMDTEYKQPVNGVYELATAGEVVWFSHMVNKVDNKINARLTDDIDFSGAMENFQQLGLKKGYGGVFDGDNHRVSNLVIEATNEDAGFISASIDGMVLRNIIFDSSCSISSTGSYVGIIGASNWGVTGTTTLYNVGNEGSVTTGGVNAGGLLGGNHNSMGIIVMKNCYTTGTVNSNGNGESAAFAGWIGKANGTIIDGCWTTAEVIGQDAGKEAYRGTSAVKNSYSIAGEQLEKFENSELGSGSLTWKLNGKTFLRAQWYQTIDEDEQPTWLEKGLVYEIEQGQYADVHDQNTYEQFRAHVVSSEKELAGETVAHDSLLNVYTDALDQMAELPTLADFLKAYGEAAPTREAIKASVVLYQAYEAQAEYALDYITNNTFSCEEADRLSSYLNENNEPSEDFPNGTYQHIMKTHQLSDAAIAAETEFVKSLLAAAIAADYQPGADITDLVTNANLEAGREGWDITSTSGSYPLMRTVEGVMAAGEAWNCNFTMTQTMKGLKPGVYVLSSNAAFRPGADTYGTFYAGHVILGDNINYAMGEIEDAISENDAVDGENCVLTGSDADYSVVYDDGTKAWVPKGPVGCAYAFKAGRYPNLVAVQIAEGDSLVLGVKNPGTGYDRDWMGFGNFHLTYLGTAAQGAEQLALVLKNYLDRARVIDAYEMSDGPDFALHPNFAKALQDQLKTAITAAEAATEGEDMLKAINTFSDLFKQIYECRIAYIAMAKSAETLSNMASTFQSQGVYEENAPELDNMNNVSEELWSAYSQGVPSAEEARNLAKGIYDLAVFPKQEDNFFQLATSKDMQTFSAMVNGGMNTIKGKLVADIDMSAVDNFIPIGFNVETANSTDAQANKVNFRGEFDGQLHRISNLKVDYENSIGVGLFGTIYPSAQIRNLVLDATCSIRGKDRVGLIGRSNSAGIIKLDCLGNEGSVEATYQAAAGILGNANDGSIAYITNCYSTGHIKAGSGKNAAQICGWLGKVGARITNCWSTSLIEGYDSQAKLFCRFSSNTTLTNCFSIDGDGTQAVRKADYEFASGEITWELNGKSTEKPVWFQKLGTDLVPVLFADHGIVVEKDGTFTNMGGDAIENVEATLGETASVYDVQGRLVRPAMPVSQALQGLPQGMYILRGTSVSRKVLVK